MNKKRAIELLNEVINYICIARNSHEAIEELLNIGFSEEELIQDFNWSSNDVEEVSYEMRNGI